jgi:hypothetical protein
MLNEMDGIEQAEGILVIVSFIHFTLFLFIAFGSRYLLFLIAFSLDSPRFSVFTRLFIFNNFFNSLLWFNRVLQIDLI